MPECEGEGLLTIFNSVPAMRLLENVVMMGENHHYLLFYILKLLIEINALFHV